MSDYTFEEILPGIVVVPYPFRPGAVVAMTLVKGETLAIIDTGMAELMPAAIEPALAALGAQVSEIGLIINTHGHLDHYGGNAVIQQASGAPVWAPAGDADGLPTPPDRRLVEGDVVDLGQGMVFEMVALPGHTAGILGLYNRARRLLIAADALQARSGSGFMPLLFDSGMTYRASIEKALAMDIDVLILGHGYQWSGESRLVHRGADVQQFLQESLDTALHTRDTVARAVAACPDHTWDCIQATVFRHFGQDPAQLAMPMIVNTIKAELRDLGIPTP